MTTLILYNWRYWDDLRGKHMVTRWKATEAEIRRRYPDATPVESSLEIRVVPEEPLDNSMARFLRGHDK